MRVNDLTPPVYERHPLGPASPLASWQMTPRVILERLPTPVYAWDDEDPAVVWDAPGDVYVWDAPSIGGGYVDATCDFQAIELEAGNPDEIGLFQSARALVSLDNRSGDWSTYDESGRLVYFAPGRRLHVLAAEPDIPPVPQIDGWLTPGTGFVTTADAPDLNITGNIRFTAKIRDDSTESATSRTIIDKLTGGQYAYRALPTYATAFYGMIAWQTAAGAGQVSNSVTRTVMGLTPPGTVRWVGSKITNVGGAGNVSVQHIQSTDGMTWTNVGAPQTTIPQGYLTRDTTAPLYIGQLFVGRIYWAQAETLDAAGNPTGVIWRFDANDYPGTGVSYTDPRGRLWSLTGTAAITPKIPEIPAQPGPDWWLFSGTVDRWDVAADDSVAIEAHDRFSGLAQEIGEFTPGVAGERPRDRLTTIAYMAGDPANLRMDPGDVTLTRQLTDRSPLEEMQTVALSDAGVLYADADGALVYRDRLWPRGRDDQTRLDVFSDNVCTAPAIVWDLELSAADEHLVTSVRLANVAGTVVTATSTDPLWADRPYPYTHPEPDQWTTSGEGQAVADVILDLYDDPKVGVGKFDLHLLDPNQNLWRTGVDLRLGDRIRLLHDYVAAGGGLGSFDLTLVVSSIRHEITPDGWLVGVGTTPAVTATRVQRWDLTDWLWDDAAARWDY